MSVTSSGSVELPRQQVLNEGLRAHLAKFFRGERLFSPRKAPLVKNPSLAEPEQTSSLHDANSSCSASRPLSVSDSGGRVRPVSNARMNARCASGEAFTNCSRTNAATSRPRSPGRAATRIHNETSRATPLEPIARSAVNRSVGLGLGPTRGVARVEIAVLSDGRLVRPSSLLDSSFRRPIGSTDCSLRSARLMNSSNSKSSSLTNSARFSVTLASALRRRASARLLGRSLQRAGVRELKGPVTISASASRWTTSTIECGKRKWRALQCVDENGTSLSASAVAGERRRGDRIPHCSVLVVPEHRAQFVTTTLGAPAANRARASPSGHCWMLHDPSGWTEQSGGRGTSEVVSMLLANSDWTGEKK